MIKAKLISHQDSLPTRIFEGVFEEYPCIGSQFTFWVTQNEPVQVINTNYVTELYVENNLTVFKTNSGSVYTLESYASSN